MIHQNFFKKFLQALTEIHGSLDRETTQEAVVRNSAQLFEAKGASLMLYDPTEEILKASTTYGLSEAYRTKGVINPQKSLKETIKGEPVLIKDTATDPDIQYRQAALDEGVESIIGLPISAGSILMGSLRLYFAQAKDFTPEEMEYLNALPKQVGLALKKSFYVGFMQDAASELHRMPALHSAKDAMKALVRIAAQYGNARGCALYLVNPKKDILENVVSFGLSDDYLKKGPLSLEKSLGEIKSGQPVVISDALADPRVQYYEQAAKENIRAIIGLPVWIGEMIAGSLRLYYSFKFDPKKDDMLLLEQLAHHSGMALEKNQLLIQLKDRHDWYKDVLSDFMV